jgi:hypothetical protein
LEIVMSAPHVNMLVTASAAPEVRLPDSKPLTLTRNFGWIVAFCVGSLLTAPAVIVWMASSLLN